MTLLGRQIPPILADLGLITQGSTSAWAVTDPTDTYRYVLGRMWDDYFFYMDEGWVHDPPRPLWVWGMLNPSKARHDVDDPSVRKVIGFSRRGGAGGIMIVNMAAYSETHPDLVVVAMRSGVDIIGPHNYSVLKWALGCPSIMGLNIAAYIAAWGRIPPRLRTAMQPSINVFRMSQAKCFGRCADGSPRHPLMLSYSTPMEDL
jgi:hypothetical protein